MQKIRQKKNDEAKNSGANNVFPVVSLYITVPYCNPRRSLLGYLFWFLVWNYFVFFILYWCWHCLPCKPDWGGRSLSTMKSLC